MAKADETWIRQVYDTCFEMMEGCDEPEWSLYSGIADVIASYMRGESGYSICNPFEHDGCPVTDKVTRTEPEPEQTCVMKFVWDDLFPAESHYECSKCHTKFYDIDADEWNVCPICEARVIKHAD